MENKNKYFIFMDESGNNAQDRFFVLGILLVHVNDIGDLFNFLENISSKIKNQAKEFKNKRIDNLYKNNDIDSLWDNYLNTAAVLISNSLKNIDNPGFVIVADQITQSKKDAPYEISLSDKIYDILKIRPFGVIRAESHSSVFLQLADIFVGSIGYDLIGHDKLRKLNFMKVLRKYLNVKNKINKDIFTLKPNWFSVFQMKKGSWL